MRRHQSGSGVFQCDQMNRWSSHVTEEPSCPTAPERTTSVWCLNTVCVRRPVQVHTDQDSGKVFYFHPVTRQTTWTDPHGPPPPPARDMDRSRASEGEQMISPSPLLSPASSQVTNTWTQSRDWRQWHLHLTFNLTLLHQHLNIKQEHFKISVH